MGKVEDWFPEKVEALEKRNEAKESRFARSRKQRQQQRAALKLSEPSSRPSQRRGGATKGVGQFGRLEGSHRVSTYIEDYIYEAAKKYAREHRIPLRSVVEQALWEYLFAEAEHPPPLPEGTQRIIERTRKYVEDEMKKDNDG